MKMLLLAILTVLVAGCALYPLFPSCPTDDVYGYLSCAKPTFSHTRDETNEELLDEDLREHSEHIIASCRERPSLYLPVLDEVVRKRVPEIRRILRANGNYQKYYFHTGWSYTLKNDDLFRGVLGTYTFILGFPAATGHDRARSCLNLLDELNDDLLLSLFRNDVKSEDYKDVIDY